MKVGFIWGHLSDPGCLAVLGTLSILGSPRASCITLYQKHIFLMVCIATKHNGRRCVYVQLGGRCPEVAEQRVGDTLLGVRRLKSVPSPDGFPGLKRDPETDRRFTR